MGRALIACALALLVSVCTVPYQPAQAEIVELGPDAFDIALDVTRANYPDLAVVDREAFRIQSGWLPHLSGDQPGKKRATVFLEDHRTLNVVVETRYLGSDLLGSPRWGDTIGDAALERRLLQALVAALGPQNSPDGPGR